MHPDRIIATIQKELRREIKRLVVRRQSVFDRFPLIFTLLVAVGGVATFSGINKLVEKVDWLSRNPWWLLGFGLSILVLTGTLYKKLR